LRAPFAFGGFDVVKICHNANGALNVQCYSSGNFIDRDHSEPLLFLR
jgi:hypothetical protein